MDALRGSKRWWVPGVVVLVTALAVMVALVGWNLLDDPDRQLARADASALSRAVADHVAEHGELPRVTVTQLDGVGGDILWGDEFVVESRRVSRADPSRAVGFFVVGAAQRWCVELEYQPSGLLVFLDTSPRWVRAEGEGGRARRVVNGRCSQDADLLLHLAPVDRTDRPAPGSVIDVATARVGTCLWNPSAGGDFISDTLDVTGRAEVVACDTAHVGEVYHAGELTDPTYATAGTSAAQSCSATFPLFVGVPHNLSAFTTEVVIVSEPRWQAGERTFSCVLFLSTQAYSLIGSAKDSWR